MSPEPQLHYLCVPTEYRDTELEVQIVPVQDFLSDEPACKALWGMIGDQFRTRGKFLAVWPSVRYVAVHRDPAGEVAGLLLVSAPINWQIDYVVVRPDYRGRGVARALLVASLNFARDLNVPYVMLSSKESLRPLYEGCGFTAVGPAVEMAGASPERELRGA